MMLSLMIPLVSSSMQYGGFSPSTTSPDVSSFQCFKIMFFRYRAAE